MSEPPRGSLQSVRAAAHAMHWALGPRKRLAYNPTLEEIQNTVQHAESVLLDARMLLDSLSGGKAAIVQTIDRLLATADDEETPGPAVLPQPPEPTPLGQAAAE